MFDITSIVKTGIVIYCFKFKFIEQQQRFELNDTSVCSNHNITSMASKAKLHEAYK